MKKYWELVEPALLYEVSIFSALWMIFPESWKRSCPNFYANDCKLQRISNVTIKKNFYRCNHMRFCRRFLSLGSRIYRRGIRILFFTRYFRRFGKNWRRRAGRITPRHDGEFLLKQSDFCQFNLMCSFHGFTIPFSNLFSRNVFVAIYGTSSCLFFSK